VLSGGKKVESRLLEHLYAKGDRAVSLIGEEIKIEGNLIFGEGVVRLDGTIQGTVTGRGTLIVGEKGDLKGEVEVGNLLLCGRADGNLRVAQLTHITPTGKLLGKISTGRIIIEEGGVLHGESLPMRPGEVSQPSV
jgi:cytoskeletal protein CcmA (bactofilin family)